MTEAELQAAVIDMAHLFGWFVLHIRPARTQTGWKTPVAADGVGFPDLFLVKPKRALAAEMKRKGGKLTPGQHIWMMKLQAAGIETATWRPEDWASGHIEKVLRAA